ncbi:MAG: hypothetical protein P4L27_06030, partial [Ignavibacteriaceae bacterium]|nr:hypothetical protein [Ignavibacteriaceae bacterium]
MGNRISSASILLAGSVPSLTPHCTITVPHKDFENAKELHKSYLKATLEQPLTAFILLSMCLSTPLAPLPFGKSYHPDYKNK